VAALALWVKVILAVVALGDPTVTALTAPVRVAVVEGARELPVLPLQIQTTVLAEPVERAPQIALQD
jgi:hypothetical protein